MEKTYSFGWVSRGGMNPRNEVFFRLTNGTFVRLVAQPDTDNSYWNTVTDTDNAIHVVLANNRVEFMAAVKKLFLNYRRTPEILQKLANGEMLSMRYNGAVRYVFGLELYSHGGDVVALCTEGSFPDRRWDVTPLAGFVIVRAGDIRKKEAREKAREYLRYVNDILCGNVWYFTVSVLTPGSTTLEEDSCGGYVGSLDSEASRFLQDSRGFFIHDIEEEISSDIFEDTLCASSNRV